jgi:hypothetical protein
MKFILFGSVLCLLSLFTACSQANSKPNNAVSKSLTIKDLEGSWVNTIYLDDVAKTRSPRQSFAQSGELSQLNFAPNALKNDTLFGELSYNGHEGGRFIVLPKAGNLPNSFRFGEFSEDLQDAPSDLTLENNILTITHYEPKGGGRVKEPLTFRRIHKTVQSLDDGAGIGVIQALFFGNWMLTPAKGNAEIIQIDSVGKIYSPTNYAKLSIPTDYTGPEEAHDDALVLEKNKTKPLTLHFKYKGAEVDFTVVKDGKETVVFNLSRF